MKRYFTKEDIWIASKRIYEWHEKMFNITRKMQISNNMVRYPYTPIRTIKIKNIGKNGRNWLSSTLLLGK